MTKPRIRVKAGSQPAGVVRLVPRARPAFSADAVALCEQTIERIKAGEIGEVAIAASVRGGGMTTAWSGWGGDLLAPAAVLCDRLVGSIR